MLCPFCNSEIPESSAFCGFCGKKIELPAAAVSEPAVESVPEPVAESVPEPVAENVSEPAAESVPEPVAESVPEPVAESVPEPVAENVSEPVAENVSEPVAESVPEPVAENVSEPVAENVSEPVAENVPEPVAESVPEPVAESVPEPVAESVPEPAAESVPEPAAENVSEPAANGVPIPAADTAPGGTYDNAAQPNTAVSTEKTEGGEAVEKPNKLSGLFKNKLFWICACAVAALVLLIIIAAASSASGSNKNPLKGFYYRVVADGEAIFLYNGKKVAGTDFSSSGSIAGISQDGTSAIVIDNTTLSLLSKGKATEITDDLSGSTAIISQNGKSVVYVTDDELTLYSGGKTTTIAELDNGSMTAFVVSPDGGTVVFSEYEDYKPKSASAWKSGKVTDLDAKITPIMVSNGGKMIYGIDNSNELVYIKNLKSGSEKELDTVTSVLEATSDHSGIIYRSGSSSYYFDGSLSEPIKVSGNTVSVISEGGYTSLRNDFKSFYAISGNGVYKFTKKGKEYDKDKIISGASRVKISADSKTIVYLDDDELVKVSTAKPDKKNVITDDVYSYYADPSLKYIYFLDDNDDLRYVSSKTKKICSDVMYYNVLPNGVCVFSDEDGDLYYSSKGGDRKKVSGISDVEMIVLINDMIYVRADDELYVSSDGKKFTNTGVDF